jgi:hypothetical protein
MADARHVRSSVAVLLACALVGCGGPVTDASRFESAVLLADGATVAFSFHHLTYRPATGIAAFPDGGVPDYLVDRHVVGSVNVDGTDLRILRRDDNVEWVHHGNELHMRREERDPSRLLLVSSGTTLDYQGFGSKCWWFDPLSGARTAFPALKEELALRGQSLGTSEFGDFRALDERGTLLVGSESADGTKIPKLSLRRTEGGWTPIDDIKHFYGIDGDEIHYWTLDDAATLYNWRTGQRRVVARYDPHIKQTIILVAHDPAVERIQAAAVAVPSLGVSVTSDGAQLQLGEKTTTGWSYRPIPVTAAALKR